MMKTKLYNQLALSALVMAMSANGASANEFSFPERQFTKDASAFLQGKVNSQITLHSLSKNKGKYGQVLDGQGWKFTNIDNVSTVPNSPTTVVYVNVDDPKLDWVNLQNYFKDFDGVIVIDSNKVAKLQPIGKLSEYRFEGPGPALDEGYHRLLANSNKISGNHAPVATAVIVHMRVKKITPLNIDTNGQVNGFPQARLEYFIDLKNSIFVNGDVKRFYAPADRYDDQKNPTPQHDQYVELTEYVDGVLAVARIQLNAYLEKVVNITPPAGTPPENPEVTVTAPAAAVWKTDTIVFTGATEQKCWNSGLKCGIYPLTNSTLVKIADKEDKSREVISYFTSHGAYAKAFGSKNLADHTLEEKEWNDEKLGLVDKDGTDRIYKVGQPFGLVLPFQQEHVTISTFIKDTALYPFFANKVYEGWKGSTIAPVKDDKGETDASEFYYPNPSDVSKAFEIHGVASSILLDGGKRKEANGIFLGTGTFAQVYLNKILASKKEDKIPNVKDCVFGDGEFKGEPKSSMSFEGWQPSVIAVHEYEPDTISYPPISASATDLDKKIKIQAGLTWARSKANYYPVAVKCFRKRGIFRKPQAINYLGYSKTSNPAALNEETENKSQQLYSRGITISVFKPGFK